MRARVRVRDWVRVWVRVGSGFLFRLDQFPDNLHKVNANLTADQIAGTDKERLCVSKIHFENVIWQN